MLKALIFDMDGVLIDSMPYHAAAWKKALLDNGIKINDDDVYTKEGLNPQNVISSYIQKVKKEPEAYDFEAIIKTYRQEFDRTFELKAFEGMKECLKVLHMHFKLSLVSGSHRAIVENVVDNLFPDIFEILVTGNEIKNSKPCPDPYLKAVELLGIKKDECIIIENSILGVEAAKRAEIYCIGIPTYLAPSQLKEADFVVGDHKELIKYLLSLPSTIAE